MENKEKEVTKNPREKSKALELELEVAVNDLCELRCHYPEEFDAFLESVQRWLIKEKPNNILPHLIEEFAEQKIDLLKAGEMREKLLDVAKILREGINLEPEKSDRFVRIFIEGLFIAAVSKIREEEFWKRLNRP
jgi:hypothetical protein